MDENKQKIVHARHEGEAWSLMREHRQHRCPGSTADILIPPLGGQSMVKCQKCGFEVWFDTDVVHYRGK